MLDLQEYSITNWASIVKSDKLLFDICGFETQDAPSVASYYDLLSRLWLSSHREHIRKKSKTRKFHPKPSKKLKANQKLPNKRSGIVKRLVNKLINAKLPKSRPEEILQKFLARCVVDYSGKLGLLGNPSDISVAFDGSPYYSSASHYGVKVCDCKSKGIHNCKCPRRYSDPDATWGWDSYRERWFFSNTLFNVTASDSPNNLPIYLKIVHASRHDSVTTIFAIRDIFELYPNLEFKNFLADGAMDNYPTYELLKHYDMLPFISLDSRTKAKFNYQHPSILCFDNKGIPICHGGIPYYNWGYSKPKGIKYRCWFTSHGQQPPEECKCSNSKYGKVVHIKPDYDLRMFPPVPRYSQTFKDKFKTRTSVERSNKRMFVDYHIENVRSQSSKLRFSMANFAVINIHSDAWIKHLKFSLLTTLEQVA